jgi:pantetheine-phosphate adenylyltransferase
VLNKFISGEIHELYQDTCNLEYAGNIHLSINKLAELIPSEHRNRVFCMHIDESLRDNEYRISELGFNRILNDYEIKAMEHKRKTAVYAGSFDPITEGHKEMIVKSSKMFEKVVIGVLVNNKKTPMFCMEERVQLIKKCVADIPNVEVKMFTGLLVDFALKNNAQVIIRGLRSVSDFENEIQIAMTNKELNKELETALLVPDIQHQYVSSSLVKELASMKADISWIVPNEILKDVKAKFGYEDQNYEC